MGCCLSTSPPPLLYNPMAMGHNPARDMFMAKRQNLNAKWGISPGGLPGPNGRVPVPGTWKYFEPPRVYREGPPGPEFLEMHGLKLGPPKTLGKPGRGYPLPKYPVAGFAYPGGGPGRGMGRGRFSHYDGGGILPMPSQGGFSHHGGGTGRGLGRGGGMPPMPSQGGLSHYGGGMGRGTGRGGFSNQSGGAGRGMGRGEFSHQGGGTAQIYGHAAPPPPPADVEYGLGHDPGDPE